jgi:hypothetical protein
LHEVRIWVWENEVGVEIPEVWRRVSVGEVHVEELLVPQVLLSIRQRSNSRILQREALTQSSSIAPMIELLVTTGSN